MGVLRMRRVSGAEGRHNDVMFVPTANPFPISDAQRALVFFGGDVQDYPEVMAAHRDNRNYMRWNLESTARRLSRFYPDHHVVVIRPSRIEFKSFSCYDNFVPSNNAGVPDHTPTHGALNHLQRLLENVTSKIKSLPALELIEALFAPSIADDIDIEDMHCPAVSGPSNWAQAPTAPGLSQHNHALDPLWWRDRLSLESSLLTLVGFSKGCVVLNQLVYEFHYTKTLTPGDQDMMRIIERIESLYWLDGGHAGGKNTWITSRSLLETLTRLNINMYIHVSPYQVKDEGRPWIGKEERSFTAMLHKQGAKVQRYLHDTPGMTQSLFMHFEVLSNFKRMQDTRPITPPSSDEES